MKRKIKKGKFLYKWLTAVHPILSEVVTIFKALILLNILRPLLFKLRRNHA